MATSKQFNAEQGVSVGQGVAVVDSSGNLTTQTITGRNTNADVQITPNGTGSVIVPSINKVAITQPATGSTLTIANGKTLTVNETFTMTATAGATVNFGNGGTIPFGEGGFIYDNVATLSSLVSIGTITTGTWAATPVGTAYGGTGANLANPGADRIFFWDNSATSSAWLLLGNSLAITGTSFDTVQDIRTTATPTFAGLTVNGNLTVTGTSTILNTTQLDVDDINITLGAVASPSDATATGGGITLKGTSDKTIVWDNINANWTSSEHWNLAAGKQYKINNVQIAASNLSNGTTGSNAVVLATSPTLTTPALGVATATSINKVAFTAPATGSTLTILEGKTFKVDNTLTFTGTDASSVAFGAGGTVVYTSNKLSVHAATTSAELAGVISDETGGAGGGLLVFSNSPVLTSPTLGSAAATALTLSGTNAATPLSISNTNNQNTAGVYGIINNTTYVGGAATTAIYGMANQGTYTPAAASVGNVYHGLDLMTVANGASYGNISASFARIDMSSAALGGTITNYYGSWIAAPTINVAATTNITNYYGLVVANPVQGTSQTISNVYGVASQVVSGANRYNIYASGTAINYLLGSTGIGVVPTVGKLHVAGGNIYLDTGYNYTAAVGGGYWASGSGTPYVTGWYESSGSMLFRTNTTTRISISSAGLVSLPTITTNGPMVTTGGTGAVSNIDISGNSGKYLYTDGSTVSWLAAPAFPTGLTAGSASVGWVNYAGTTKTLGQWYGGTSDPTNTTRLNFDGYLYATKIYGDLSGATGVTNATNATNLTGAQKLTIWLPAGAWAARTTNGAAPGTVETATNKIMLKTLDFDQSTEEYAQFMVAMPKSWNEGTITAQFRWSSTASGDVVWGIRAVAISDDDALDAAFGASQTITDTNGTAGDLMESAETPAITIGGSPVENDVVVLEIYRKSADAADTIAADTRLHGVKIFYTSTGVSDA
jgi:hypothetical protein